MIKWKCYVFFFRKLYFLFNNFLCFSLYKFYVEFVVVVVREKETVSVLNDVEEVLIKRRFDIVRMRD